jgi:N6-adenosine-specific RNA methylase IME4
VIPFPDKKYNIVYADPPWAMSGGVYRPKYPTMSQIDIMNLPVPTITETDCALFLWVLNSRLPEGLEVMKSWGFLFKTVAFCWVKTSRSTGMPNCRVGSYTLGGIELCLLGVKGILTRRILNIRQVLMHPRNRHSYKPNKIRDDVVDLYGDIPRIELFARQQTPGWDVWGNEVNQ